MKEGENLPCRLISLAERLDGSLEREGITDRICDAASGRGSYAIAEKDISLASPYPKAVIKLIVTTQDGVLVTGVRSQYYSMQSLFADSEREYGWIRIGGRDITEDEEAALRSAFSLASEEAYGDISARLLGREKAGQH